MMISPKATIRMNRYGISADTQNARLRSGNLRLKMMAMESSSTRNASELKNTRPMPPIQPTTCRLRRNPSTTSARVFPNPGVIRFTSEVSDSISSSCGKKCENTTISTADSGISESIML
jgi:hypothetical protein